MSQVPIMASTTVGVEHGLGDPFTGLGFRARYPNDPSQFVGAQMVAERWNLEREDLERFALLIGDLLDHRRHGAARATPGGPEVHEHRNVGLEHLCLEVVVRYF